MKYVPRMPIPWDMVVFLAITTTGFGFSLNRLTASQFPVGVSTQNSATGDLGCLAASRFPPRLENGADTIRLRGQFCHLSKRAMRSFQGVQVTNLTNGAEGTVFFQGYGASFVTDYLKLRTGRNEIKIEWREKAGDPIRRVLAEIIRAP